MTWILLALSFGCETSPTESRLDKPNDPVPPAPADHPNPGQASEGHIPEPPRVVTCADGLAANTTKVSMGTQALTTASCTIDGESRMVAAYLDTSQWRWTPGDGETEHQFKWIGNDSDGHGYMVLRYWACPSDGCERAVFFRWGTDGSIAPVGEPTSAHAWSINKAGRLEYSEKIGYNAGYSVASANQLHTWDGTTFSATGQPNPVTEFDQWICEDTTVAVVSPASGEPTGDTVSVGQGDAIEVLRVGSGQPLGSLFEYRVNGETFWASGWEQNCAG